MLIQADASSNCTAGKLPRRRWILLLITTIVSVAVGVHFAMPIYRQHLAFREIERGRDSKMPMDERKAIALAISYFAEENGGLPIDAEFSATREPDGFSVLVTFVVERDLFGRGSGMPGGHCSVNISKDGKVLDVIGGM
jgi:hypothetical protein